MILTSRNGLKRHMGMRVLVQLTIWLNQLRKLLLLQKLLMGYDFLVLRLGPGGLSGPTVVVVNFTLVCGCFNPNVAFSLVGVQRFTGRIVGSCRIHLLLLVLVCRCTGALLDLVTLVRLAVGRQTIRLRRLISRSAIDAVTVHLIV